MSGRGVRAPAGVLGAAAVVLVVSTVVGGCSPDGPAASSTPSRASTSAAPPVGSVDHPRPVLCADGATLTPSVPTTAASPATPTRPAKRHATPTRSAAKWDPSENDITVGPLTLRGLRALDDGNQYTHGVHNSEGWHYLIGTAVKAGAEVTVTIGAEQRARAGLEFGGTQGTTPAPAVTFHGCAGATTTFLGAFFIAGDGRACLPLDIRAGDGATRRVVISFYNGRCPA
jgi:hypothetical protein